MSATAIRSGGSLYLATVGLTFLACWVTGCQGERAASHADDLVAVDGELVAPRAEDIDLAGEQARRSEFWETERALTEADLEGVPQDALPGEETAIQAALIGYEGWAARTQARLSDWSRVIMAIGPEPEEWMWAVYLMWDVDEAEYQLVEMVARDEVTDEALEQGMGWPAQAPANE